MASNLTGVLRRRLVLVVAVGAALVLLSGGAFAAFEDRTVGSYWDGLYWALSLMTTVGFIGGSPRRISTLLEEGWGRRARSGVGTGH